MSQTLIVRYALAKVRVPVAVVPADFQATLQPLDEAGNPNGAPILVASPTPELSFPFLSDGTYNATHLRAAADGTIIGGKFEEVITVANGVITAEKFVDGVASVSYELVQVPDEPTPDVEVEAPVA